MMNLGVSVIAYFHGDIKSMDSRLGLGIRGFIPHEICFVVVGTRYEKTFVFF